LPLLLQIHSCNRASGVGKDTRSFDRIK
jgi:predicted small secreted protein